MDTMTLNGIKNVIEEKTGIPYNHQLLFDKHIGFLDDDRFDGNMMVMEIYQEVLLCIF